MSFLPTIDFLPEKKSPLLEGDGSFYERYGRVLHPSVSTQLVGNYFEHLAAYHLGGEVNNHTGSTLPDIVSFRHRALVEVKGCHVRTGLKVQVHQIHKLAACQHQGLDRRWFSIFLHDAQGVCGGAASATEILEMLSTSQRCGLMLDVSVLRAFLTQGKINVSGPYTGKNGGWILPEIATFRPTRDLMPLAERTESALSSLQLNPEDYDIHREVANTYTNPFILTWVVPRGTMRKVLRERCERIPF